MARWDNAGINARVDGKERASVGTGGGTGGGGPRVDGVLTVGGAALAVADVDVVDVRVGF